MNTPTRRLLGLAAVVAVVAASCSALTREPELDPPPSLIVQTGPGARFVGTAAGFSDWYGPGSMRHVGATEAGRAALEITAEPGGLQANARKALVPLRDGSPFSWSFSVRTADWSQVANIQFRLHTTDEDFFYANVRDRTARTALVDDAWQRVQLSRADFLTVGEPDWRRLEAVSFAVWGFTDGVDGPPAPRPVGCGRRRRHAVLRRRRRVGRRRRPPHARALLPRHGVRRARPGGRAGLPRPG
jgi:hypothetical protein